MEAMEDEELTSEIDMKFDDFSSEAEEDDKVRSVGQIHPLKQDDCCLLCGRLAIAYDLEGNVVKRERDEDVNEGQQQHFTCQDLFSFLCRCFKVKKDDWSFHSNSKDLFPFCEMCEFLLVSLAEIYCRLDELEEVLKAKMLEAEEDKFWKERLYMKHNDRYFTFRKQVLKEKFRGDTEDYKSESTVHNKKPPSSSIVVAKSNEVVCEVPSSSAIELQDTDTRQLRSRSCKMLRKEVPLQLPSSSEEKDKSDMDCSSDDDEQVVDMDDLLCNESESSTSSTDNDDEADSDSDKAKKRKKKTINTRKSKVNKASSDPLRNSSTREKNVKRRPPVRNPKKPENSTWRADNAGYMLMDPETGNITYTTGYGNRFRSTRTVLQFSKLGNNGGFQCCTCLDIIPFESKTGKQQSRFRDHFIRIHSPRYTCRLCQNPSRCSSQEELLQHVVSTHDMLDLQSYHKAVSNVQLKESMGKRTELKKKRESLYSDSKSNCKVCEMPFTDFERDEIKDHNMSHMNETEQQELERMDDNLSLVKTYQCDTCGKAVKGLLALRLHNKSHSKGKTCPLKKRQRLARNYKANCEVCAMPFDNLSWSSIKLHQSSHLSQEEKKQIESESQQQSPKTFSCLICRKILKSEFTLRSHEKTHEDTQYVCPICAETYKREENLNRHIEKVHPNGPWNGPYNCNYPSCGESLDTDANLSAHVEKEHTNSEEAKKQLLCLKCGRVLASSWVLKLHGLVHTKERNFKCDICLKTFPLKATLENHMATIHAAGSKCATFKCDQPGCEVEYRADVYLKAHLRRVHGVYVRRPQKKKAQNP